MKEVCICQILELGACGSGQCASATVRIIEPWESRPPSLARASGSSDNCGTAIFIPKSC